MNIDRRIKKHIHGKSHTFFVVTPPGIEAITEKELQQLGLREYHVEHGGITLEGRLTDLYLMALKLRTATKILWRIGSFKAQFPDQITQSTAKIPWEYHLKPGMVISCNTTTKHSRLFHTDLIESAYLKGINDRSELPLNIKTGKNGLPLHLRMVENRLTISIDCTAPLLYKRGYKIASVPAPIRENLAAALLLNFWDQRLPLIDPMCGSGTFSLEGYLIKSNTPPGIYRNFPFMEQPHFKAGSYQNLIKKLIGEQNDDPFQQFTGDLNPDAVKAVQANQKKLNIELNPVVADFFKDKIPFNEGLIIINPPYNKRLEYSKGAYQTLINVLKKQYQGFSVVILHPADRMLPGGFEADQQLRFKNGGINIVASYFKKFPGKLNKNAQQPSEK